MYFSEFLRMSDEIDVDFTIYIRPKTRKGKHDTAYISSDKEFAGGRVIVNIAIPASSSTLLSTKSSGAGVDDELDENEEQER